MAPNGYKGKLHAWLNVKYNFIAWRNDEHHASAVTCPDSEYVFLGSTANVDIAFCDPRGQIIESLEKQVEKERADSQRRIEMMLGKIQELRALEAPSE